MKSDEELRREILEGTRELVRRRLARRDFEPGRTTVPYAGRVYDEHEVAAGVGSMLDFWLTLGPEGDAFERELSALLGVRSSHLANSGSSANLLAISALTSNRLGDRRLRPGDEVLTAAAGFPTTVAPIVQVGAVPVFVDSDPATGNVRLEALEEAYRPGVTRAVVLAHTLGNPFDLAGIVRFCQERSLWLVEDACDALGGRYDGRPIGSFGDLSTISFYPAHQITMGEGGAVNVVREALLKVLVESFRDWGRDCWCASGAENTCNRRFDWQLGELPHGYDHKYVYRHLGYNLKPTDPQAAIGRAQLAKLSAFTARRRANWERLRAGLADLEEHLEFMRPTHATAWTPEGFRWEAGAPAVEPSWFAFMVLVRPDAPFSRTDLARALDAARIGNRMLFGGNLVRQPALVDLARERPGAFRVAGDLTGADRLLHDALFVGTYPGLEDRHLDYVLEVVHDFVRSRCGSS